MSDIIGVSSQELTNTATTIDRTNANLKQNLMDCANDVKNLQASWESDAGSDIRAAMKALQPKFEEYEKVIAAYAAFLRNTATNYENMEQTLQNNANLFK